MAHDKTGDSKTMKLPGSVLSPADLNRLARELAAIDDALLQQGIRSPGNTAGLPKSSRTMAQTAEANGLNLLDQNDRAALRHFLEETKERSPVLHISLSTDPSPAFCEELVAWLRKEIHPSALVTIGLQPNIGAGCIVRTTNRQFDLSLRQNFVNQRGLLLKKLAAGGRNER